MLTDDINLWNASEIRSGDGNKVDFHRQKAFVRPCRGRNRALPLYYNPMEKAFDQRR